MCVPARALELKRRGKKLVMKILGQSKGGYLQDSDRKGAREEAAQLKHGADHTK